MSVLLNLLQRDFFTDNILQKDTQVTLKYTGVLKIIIKKHLNTIEWMCE